MSFVVLDLALYIQHRLSHKISFLWRVHRVHHSDSMLTTSAAVRFHFVEIILSFFWKIFWVLILGTSLSTYVLFEIFLNACAVFNHSNLKLPKRLNQLVGFVFVTPDLHRLHHSTNLKESNKNFGFSIIFWDKAFRSFSTALTKNVGVMGMKGEGFKEQVLLRKGE